MERFQRATDLQLTGLVQGICRKAGIPHAVRGTEARRERRVVTQGSVMLELEEGTPGHCYARPTAAGFPAYIVPDTRVNARIFVNGVLVFDRYRARNTEPGWHAPVDRLAIDVLGNYEFS